MNFEMWYKCIQTGAKLKQKVKYIFVFVTSNHTELKKKCIYSFSFDHHLLLFYFIKALLH